MEDAFTLAHEMGHGMHGNLSRRNQPFDTYEYSTFVAETASIFNEALFHDQLLASAKEPELRIALLQYRIDPSPWRSMRSPSWPTSSSGRTGW